MKYLLSLVFLAMPFFASAALLSSGLNVLQVSTVPENPRPGDQVTLNANLIGADPHAVSFRWVVDGQIQQGVGLDSIVVTAPALGQGMAVAVSANVSGQTTQTSFVLQPSEVTIEWEGNTATAPFFEGRPLADPQGGITATAIPALIGANGVALAPTTINYTWSLNGTVMGKSSGRGVQTIHVNPPFFSTPFKLSVVAKSVDGSLSADNSVIIVPHAPSVVIYEDSPLGGVLTHRAIQGDYTFNTDEVTFIGYPLYVVDPKSLNYTWTLNGQAVDGGSDDPRTAIFKKTGSGTGQYTVALGIDHVARFLEKTASSFTLTF